MAIVRKTITLTDKQDNWIKAQIEEGNFTNESEYIRDLVRRDLQQHSTFLATKTAIMEGIESGISELNSTPKDVMEASIKRIEAKKKGN